MGKGNVYVHCLVVNLQTLEGFFLPLPGLKKERNKGFTGKKYFCNLAAHVSDVCPPSTTHIYVRRGAKQNFSEQEKLFSAECRLCVFDHLTEVKSWSGQSCFGLDFLLHGSKSNVWNKCLSSFLPADKIDGNIITGLDIWAVTKRICPYHSPAVGGTGRSSHKI